MTDYPESIFAGDGDILNNREEQIRSSRVKVERRRNLPADKERGGDEEHRDQVGNGVVDGERGTNGMKENICLHL